MPVIWASRNIISGIRVFRSPLPPTSPRRARRPYCARLFMDDWIVAAPTVSITTLAPWSAVRAIIISAKSSSPVSITWSAPNAVRDGAFLGDDVTARARAPGAASWMAWTPSPPPAPVMATVSPGARAVAVRACRATPAGQARRADWARGRASGMGIRLCWEMATYSANPPSRAWPMPGPRRQRRWRPARQRSHWPQALVSSATTRSPGWTRWTSVAVSSTEPAISWPRVMPVGRRGGGRRPLLGGRGGRSRRRLLALGLRRGRGWVWGVPRRLVGAGCRGFVVSALAWWGIVYCLGRWGAGICRFDGGGCIIGAFGLGVGYGYRVWYCAGVRSGRTG